MEIWKDVDGYSGLYQVSNTGKVKRVDVYPNRLLKCSARKDGYIAFSLAKNGKNKFHYLHRVVAAAFIGKCPNGYTVNHKDGVKSNNNVSNLEYMTRAENSIHQHVNGLGVFVRGDRIGTSKLKTDEVEEIKSMLERGIGGSEISRKFGVSPSAISYIKNGKSWCHLK